MATTKQFDAREARLHRFFVEVINGKKLQLKNDARHFIAGMCLQPEPTACMDKLRVSSAGLSAINDSLVLCVETDFLNGPATDLLKYIQAPSLRSLTGGKFLDKVILTIIEPRFFWDAYVDAFKNGDLVGDANRAFAWLLQQAISLPSDKAAGYLQIASDKDILKKILDSTDSATRIIGARIKHILATISQPVHDDEDSYNSPGGRHNNDYVDFRDIQILPTTDELLSKEPAFLRLAADIDLPETLERRPAIHLDNQFRLLREDMLDDLSSDVNMVLKKPKSFGRRLMITDFIFLDKAECGTPERRQQWSLRIQCKDDIPQLKHLSGNARKDFITNNKKFVKHQALACLIIDGEIIAFPTIVRQEDLLAQKPPILVLQFPTGPGTQTVFNRIHTANGKCQLLQLETALFSYEPILKGLQRMKEIPLSEEVLYWKPGAVLDEPEYTVEEHLAIESVKQNPKQDLQSHLQTPHSIILDESQYRSFLTGLTQRVSLIQGPPGTGKSFLGALMAKSIYLFSKKKILVCVYTNHALDQFLEDLLDIGIPESAMVRLGGKSTARTEPLMLHSAKSTRSRLNGDQYAHMKKLRTKASLLEIDLQERLQRYIKAPVTKKDLMDHIDFEAPEFWTAFQIPASEDGMTIVGKKNKAVEWHYLLDQWINGKDAGIFKANVSPEVAHVWTMKELDRNMLLARWQDDILKLKAEELTEAGMSFNEVVTEMDELQLAKDGEVIREKRIVACTTTAAAKYSHIIQNADIDVVLVEEAGEILESHVLTALGPRTNQMILIGDHQQLRPKVNKYNLMVEKGDGYDLNRSLFERLVLKGYPHETLTKQHRMRPEISKLVRELTYPDLEDAPRTLGRADIKGLQDNVVFINHSYPELTFNDIADKKDMNATSSKKNIYEVHMILQCVKYLAQQGYGTEELVILTPYLAQLQELRKELMSHADPVLSDLDSFELVRAGLMTPASAKLTKKQIRLATIDNFQGEEGKIVIISLTRSNERGDIGFMFAPERLNVLLSRARDGMIMIGNAETFRASRKGGKLWSKFLDLVQPHIYDGLPIRCERHPDRTCILRTPADFAEEAPEGGCRELCGVLLRCKLHKCPLRCHNLDDHSEMLCEFPLHKICQRNPSHRMNYLCHKGPPPVCEQCERDDAIAIQRLKDDIARKEALRAEQAAHDAELAAIELEMRREQQARQDEQLRFEQANERRQREQDLHELRNRPPIVIPPQFTPTTVKTVLSPPVFPPAASILNGPINNTPGPASTVPQPSVPGSLGTQPASSASPSPSQAPTTAPTSSNSQPPPAMLPPSPSKLEWERQKITTGASNKAIDELMDMIGLEEVKDQVLKIKAKVDITLRQGTSLKSERFNISLVGNPGTGKTTVARLYAKFLVSVGLLPGSVFVEKTGASLASDGVQEMKATIGSILAGGGGGALFVDEAYQLITNPGGQPVLDYLLAEIENNVGKLVVIAAGYKDDMEKFFEHNPGLPSRFPYTLEFKDYTNLELRAILKQLIQKRYNSQMVVEDGLDGLYMRMVINRIGWGREAKGFGNARKVQNVFAQITQRQAQRVHHERKNGLLPSDFYMTKEDLIGPDPAKAILNSAAWTELQGLIGLDSVKKSVRAMIDRVKTNYKRELREKKPLEMSLNRQFTGSPGTGKTTVAKLYGQILADIGLLSNGQVLLKSPSDFIGSVIGESEKNTKGILSSAVGKVLIIDEAYMFYQSNSDHASGHSDTFRTAVIDTIVAEVQNVPGEDRCVLLLGYQEQMDTMFQNVNPGLQRRFPKSASFVFDDFTSEQLGKILDYKLIKGNIDATDDAKKLALDILDRKRSQLNFGNAGDVENMITQAKELYQQRFMDLPEDQRPEDMVLDPIDFDPDFARGASASINLDALFADVVDSDDVKEKLRGYQGAAAAFKARGKDPRTLIPTTFVFKGPPGTGKTTTARKVGQVFYDMGFLSSAEVIECSASDLVGQYIGHTGPKTRKKVDSALGKVLFIDEAYRLGEGRFAQEAMDELCDLLTKPNYIGKIVIILAGYEHDINNLLSTNPGLSSRFSEEIFFRAMTSEASLALLDMMLDKQEVELPELKQKTSRCYNDLKVVIEEMMQLPSWGNGRDVSTLAKNMVQEVYRNFVRTNSMAISPQDALKVAVEMLQERTKRVTNVNPQRRSSWAGMPPPLTMGPPTQQAPPTATRTATATKAPTYTPSDSGDEDEDEEEEEESSDDDGESGVPRDNGVSLEDWQLLEKYKEEARLRQLQYDRIEEDRAKAEKERERLEELMEKLRLEKIRDDEAIEAARLEKLAQEEELERLRKLQEKKEKEERAQAKLATMGVCPMGYVWIKMPGGYVCAGGAHFVGNAYLV